MSARARTAAGSKERGRPRAEPEVFCENHLRVCRCARGWRCPFFCEAEALHHCPVGLDAGEGAEPLTLGEMCVLRLFVQGSAGLSSPAPSPAASPAPSPAASPAPSPDVAASPASSAATLAMSSCTATCSATAAIVSCIGCPRRHHTGGSCLSSPTLRSMASMSSIQRVWKASHHDVHGHVAMGAEDAPSVHGATRDWHPPPVEHADALLHVLCMTKKFCARQNSQAMASLYKWCCFTEKLTSSGVALQTNKNSQAMALLHKQGSASNGVTRQKDIEAQPNE